MVLKNRWQELWYVTLPQMKSQLMFGALIQITSAFSIGSISIGLLGFPSVDYSGHTINYASSRFWSWITSEWN